MTDDSGGTRAQGAELGWFDLAMREYGYHRTAIDKFDTLRLRIRNWAITVAGGLVAVAITNDVTVLIGGAIATTLLFGSLEVLYMMIQSDVITRSNELEELVNDYRATGKEPDDFKFGVSYAYRESFYWHRATKVLLNRGRVHIWGFYLALILTIALAAVLVQWADLGESGL